LLAVGAPFSPHRTFSGGISAREEPTKTARLRGRRCWTSIVPGIALSSKRSNRNVKRRLDERIQQDEVLRNMGQHKAWQKARRWKFLEVIIAGRRRWTINIKQQPPAELF